MRAFKRIPTRFPWRLRRPGVLARSAPFPATPAARPRQLGSSRDRVVIGPRADLGPRAPPPPFPAPSPPPGRCLSPASAPVADSSGAASFSSPKKAGKQPRGLFNSQGRARAGVRSTGGRRGCRGAREREPGALGPGADLGSEEGRGLPCGRVARLACPRVRVGFRMTPLGFAFLVGIGGEGRGRPGPWGGMAVCREV